MDIRYGTQALTDFLAARHQLTWGVVQGEEDAQKVRQQNGASDDSVMRGSDQEKAAPPVLNNGGYDTARN